MSIDRITVFMLCLMCYLPGYIIQLLYHRSWFSDLLIFGGGMAFVVALAIWDKLNKLNRDANKIGPSFKG